jgi:hypothetical protein
MEIHNLENNQEEEKETIKINLEGETDEEIMKDLEKKLPDEARPKNTIFNKLIAIIDGKLFKLSEKIIMKYVKAKKFEYNKYDIFAKFRMITAIIFIAAIFIIGPLTAFFSPSKEVFFSFFSIIVDACIYGLMASLEYKGNLYHKLNSLDYQPLFRNRQNPIVYKYVRLKNKVSFLAKKKRRFFVLKGQLTAYFVFFLLTFSCIFYVKNYFINILIFFIFSPSIFVSLLENYSEHIFDFDEPQVKRKKEKVFSLTKILQKVFDEMVGRTKEVPVGIQS